MKTITRILKVMTALLFTGVVYELVQNWNNIYLF